VTALSKSETPTTDTQSAPAPGRRREGRGFFLTLLITSGILILFLWIFIFQGKAVSVFLFKKFVINKAFASHLPKAYTLEQAEALRGRVYNFYDLAAARGLSDFAIYQVSQQLQKIMADEAISDAEVKTLLAVIETAERAP